MPAGDNAFARHVDPVDGVKTSDYEDTGRTENGRPVLVPRVKVVNPETGFATDATLNAVLTELGQKLEPADLAALATAAKQDAAKAVLDNLLLAVDGLEAKDYATQTTLAAVLTELGQKLEPTDLAALATDAVLQAVRDRLPAALDADGGLKAHLQNGATLAQEATVAKRYAGGKSAVTAQVTAAGDTTIHAPAAGSRIRLFWVSAISDPDESSTPLIGVRLGAAELYSVYALAHWELFEGAVDAPLVVNLDGAGQVAVTAHYEEFS